MTARKKPAAPAQVVPDAPVLDLRSLLERAAQDDPVISAHFTLEADGLLHCRHCDFVTAQENNAAAHVEVEARQAPREIPAYLQHFDRGEDGLLHCKHCYFVTAQELNAEVHLQLLHGDISLEIQEA